MIGFRGVRNPRSISPPTPGKSGRIARRAVYAGFLIVFGLVAAELLLRLDRFAPRFRQAGLEIVLDRELLFRNPGNGRRDLNRLGFRDDDFGTKASDAERILFLGDSFVFGRGVDRQQSIPEQLEARLDHAEVLNLGVNGYGPDQSLLVLRSVGFALEPDRVLLGVYPGNDFRDLAVNGLFELGEDGELRATDSNAVSDEIPRLRILYLMQFLRYRVRGGSRYDALFRTLFDDGTETELLLNPESEFAQERYALMKGVLRQFRDELARRGIPLLVVIIPSYLNVEDVSAFRRAGIPEERYFSLEDRTDRICEKLGIDRLNLSPLMAAADSPEPLFSASSLHLTRRGARFAASAIEAHLDEERR